MASAGEVGGRLRAAVEKLPMERLQAHQNHLGEQASATLQQLTAGTSRAEPGEALALIREAAADLAEATRLLGWIAGHVDAWIAEDSALGSPPVALTPAPTALTPAEPEPAARFVNDPRPLPERAADVIATLPERTDTSRKTDGFWIDENEKIGGQIRSGEREVLG